MSVFTQEDELLKQNGAYHTVKEILQQPEKIKENLSLFENNMKDTEAFLANVKNCNAGKKVTVIFTGAGSSEYVGNVLCEYLMSDNDIFEYRSIATTAIVSNPYLYFNKDSAVLLVSFARSGNSPESLAAVNLVNQIVKKPFHLAITCASHGKLARCLYDSENSFVYITPAGTNDVSFAMTSSFSTMLHMALLVFSQKNFEYKKNQSLSLVRVQKDIFERVSELTELVDFNFERVVYLGSGLFKYLCQETQLKVLELTAGKIATCYDSSMGFRHGPKSFINEKTMLVSFVSNNKYTRLYDSDIIAEITADGICNSMVITSETLALKAKQFVLKDAKQLDDIYIAFAYLQIGQIVATQKSVLMNNTPDTPNASGTVNRVVKGVIIHKYE